MGTPIPNDARGATTSLAPNQSDERLQMKVGGMHCSLCVEAIQRALRRIEGVHAVQVSIAHGEALVRYDPARVGPAVLRETLEEIGYSVREPDRAETFAEEERELAAARRGAIAAGALLVAASALMAAMAGAAPQRLPMIGMGALALFAAFGPARFILLRNGWQSVRRGILNQDVLVSVSALGGLLGGIAGLLLPAWPAGGFFGAAVFVLSFHLIGGYASVLVHVRASQSVRRLLALAPLRARRLDAQGREAEVPIEELEVGDRVRVRPGERIPADGRVEEGATAVDESLVTGESMPQDRLPGDELIGGSLNQAGSVVLRVTRVGKDSFLRTVARQVAEARAMKPGVLRLVDRVLLVYVPAVFAAGGAGLLLWTAGAWIGTGSPDWLRAGFAALGALILGYPCALGMATPLAIIRASGEAARRGILMRSGEAFQLLQEARSILLDKTGTLTEGKPRLVDLLLPAGAEEEERAVLRLAARAELPSEHPLARAIVVAARARSIEPLPPDHFEARPGYGVIAGVEGRRVVVGTARLLAEEGIDPAAVRPLLGRAHAAGQTGVLVAVDGRAVGVLALADRLKADAREAVQALKQAGLDPILISGDNERTARAVARQAGIPRVLAGALPGRKAAEVRRLQEQGMRVAMVGDGINDAPALMQADVGIAIGAGTDIAIEAADVVLVGGRLGALAEARQLARRSYRLTLTNVVLALGFNGIGVLAAVTGLVHPVWAMLAMAVSVSVVLANSFAGRLLPGAPNGRGAGIRKGKRQKDR